MTSVNLLSKRGGSPPSVGMRPRSSGRSATRPSIPVLMFGICASNLMWISANWRIPRGSFRSSSPPAKTSKLSLVASEHRNYLAIARQHSFSVAPTKTGILASGDCDCTVTTSG